MQRGTTATNITSNLVTVMFEKWLKEYLKRLWRWLAIPPLEPTYG